MKRLYVAENRILVKPAEVADKSEGGIYLTDTTKDNQRGSRSGEIIAVGVRRIDATGQRFDSQFSPGQTAVYGMYSGTETKVEGVDYVILREDDVLLAM